MWLTRQNADILTFLILGEDMLSLKRTVEWPNLPYAGLFVSAW